MSIIKQDVNSTSKYIKLIKKQFYGSDHKRKNSLEDELNFIIFFAKGHSKLEISMLKNDLSNNHEISTLFQQIMVSFFTSIIVSILSFVGGLWLSISSFAAQHANNVLQKIDDGSNKERKEITDYLLKSLGDMYGEIIKKYVIVFVALISITFIPILINYLRNKKRKHCLTILQSAYDLKNIEKEHSMK